MVSDVSLEMQSDSKNYVGLQDDEIAEPVHTIKPGGDSHMKQTGMLVGNFEFNP